VYIYIHLLESVVALHCIQPPSLLSKRALAKQI
jgi:hypothetical protein